LKITSSVTCGVSFILIEPFLWRPLATTPFSTSWYFLNFSSVTVISSK
jgi:hypothetical protein